METEFVNIILEGTSYSNTKSISIALSEYPPLVGQIGYQRYTAVISSKWGYFKDFPWGKKLIDFNPAEEEQAMTNFGIWMRLIELQRHFNWIIDCFHLSSQHYQQLNNKNYCDFHWLEERLLKQGFHLVHVFKNDEALLRTMSYQDFDGTNDEIAHVFQERDFLGKLVSKSILPTLELDTSGMSIGDVVGNITDWYEEVSGYTQPRKQALEKIFLPSC